MSYMISIASSANINYLKNYEMLKISGIVDWINIMSYDFHGPFMGDADKFTGFNAALYMDPKDPEEETIKEAFNLNATIYEYIQLGIPKSKINAGLAFYGRGYGGVTVDSNNGLYVKYTGVPSKGTWENGVWDYLDLE